MNNIMKLAQEYAVRYRVNRAVDEARAALEAAVEQLEKDSARLAYVYSGKTTTSNALVLIEMRLINDDIPTIDEVRAAIDNAMEAK